MENNKPGTQADYLIKQKGPDGKSRIVGRGWKKTSAYGPFISLSIGDKDNRQSYIMVKAEPKPEDAVRTTPPKTMPVKAFPDDGIDDL